MLSIVFAKLQGKIAINTEKITLTFPIPNQNNASTIQTIGGIPKHISIKGLKSLASVLKLPDKMPSNAPNTKEKRIVKNTR